MKRLLHFLHRTFIPTWVGLAVLIAGITVFCGYGGDIDAEVMPFAGVANMVFPFFYILSAVMLIIALLICRLSAIPLAAGMIATLKPLLIFAPLNFGPHELKPDERNRAFKIMSYNVLSFVDEERPDSRDTYNRTMHSILASDADAIVMLEYENQGPLRQFMPQSQIDSLNTLYPYFARGSRGTVIYSRTPILHIIPPDNMPKKGSIETFRTMFHRRPLNIFAVHLESIGLNANDKELYVELTSDKSPERVDMDRVRAQLIQKLYNAFINRANQAKQLRYYAEYLGGDLLICGDFNDVPGCRCIKILEEGGFKDVYSAVGCGPTITFNADRFYFRIDHMLWKGGFHPVSIERGGVPSSDHYPLTATFVWDD